MGWSTNQKAVEKREKEAAKKRDKNQQKQEARQKQKWKDEVTEKKIQTAVSSILNQQQREERRLKELERKQEIKRLAEIEEIQLEKELKKKKEKNQFNEKKLTQAQIRERQEAKLIEQLEKSLGNDQNQYFSEENPNRNLDGFEVANTVDKALQILEDGIERHPERRFKAAFQAYCEKREKEIKIDYPKFKRSKRLDLMRKEFEKHPENPYNKKNVVNYNFNPNPKAEPKQEE